MQPSKQTEIKIIFLSLQYWIHKVLFVDMPALQNIKVTNQLGEAQVQID